jgi:hypothetical protein
MGTWLVIGVVILILLVTLPILILRRPSDDSARMEALREANERHDEYRRNNR